MWMAHMFTYCLDKGDSDPVFDTLLIDFIDTSLDSKSPTRLVADCFLLSGMLLDLQIDRRHLPNLTRGAKLFAVDEFMNL